ncbi:MAG: dicarboxylate/amino acid:cation symporter [Bacteroidales bacterium]|nr:dicarboxylate/amino acid:cation symporter [Bacteroidales bacterium]
MKKIRIALIWKVLAACALGGLLGRVLPVPAIRVFTTFNYVFSQYIGFMVPLIIVGLVTPAICKMGAGAGRMLVFTIALAYTCSVVAGMFSYGVTTNVFPMILGEIKLDIGSSAADDVPPFFKIDIPAFFGVTSALVFSFLAGTLLTVTGNRYIKDFAFDFEDLVSRAIAKTLIPILPIYIFGIFLKMSHGGEMLPMIRVFAQIIVIIFAMSLIWLVIMFCISGSLTRRNPFKCIAKMLPAYLTALATSSSAATIPVTVGCARGCGVSEPVSKFSVPLCATIHMPGSMMKITACAIAIMMLQDIPFSADLILRFAMLLAITAVAAPGVPGGVLMASLGVQAEGLGCGDANQALMITLYIVMDSFGTACNVMADGAVAMIVEKVFGSYIDEDDD